MYPSLWYCYQSMSLSADSDDHQSTGRTASLLVDTLCVYDVENILSKCNYRDTTFTM